MTIFSRGTALFGGETARVPVRSSVPFCCGSILLRAFFYVLVGFRLLHSRRLTVWLPIAIAAATGLILAAFGVHVAGGGLYKMHPLRARLLRAAVWACIAAVLWRAAAGIRN